MAKPLSGLVQGLQQIKQLGDFKQSAFAALRLLDTVRKSGFTKQIGTNTGFDLASASKLEQKEYGPLGKLERIRFKNAEITSLNLDTDDKGPFLNLRIKDPPGEF